MPSLTSLLRTELSWMPALPMRLSAYALPPAPMPMPTAAIAAEMPSTAMFLSCMWVVPFDGG